jgi:ABC-type transport system involved in multi-copper enzyme maturation permease subunit
MTLLPILERELRVAARKPALYKARLGASVAILVVIMPLLVTVGQRISPRQMGAGLFQSLIWYAFIYALVVGAGAAADCISQEKRDGTLGFLFLTDLTAFDIIMGKLVSNSLSAVYGLLAVVPVLTIPILLGGVTFGQVALVAVALVNTIFFSLSASVLASTRSHDARRASGTALLIILFLVLLLPLLVFATGAYLDSRGIHLDRKWFGIVLLPNPAFAFSQVSTQMGGFLRGWSFWGAFWGSVAVTHLLSWGMIFWASRILRCTWQDKPATVVKIRWQDRRRNWLQGSAEARREFRRRLLNMHPICWLASRDRLKPVYPWIFLASTVVIWFWAFAKLRGEWLNIPMAVSTVLVLHLTLKTWVASEAAQRFSEDLRSGALELILSSPLSVEEILHGQWLALRRQFFKPAIAILIIDLVMLGISFGYGELSNPGEVASLIATFLAGMIMLLADMYALAWTGMWCAISTKDTRKASGKAGFRILFLPWVVFGILTALFALAVDFFRVTWEPGYDCYLGLWFAIGILFDIVHTRHSRRSLRAEFRTLAMQRYSGETGKTFWYWLGSSWGKLWAKPGSNAGLPPRR